MKKRITPFFIIFLSVTLVSVTAYCGDINFSDLPATHWARGNISTLVEDGVISGYPDGQFKPEGTITYAEFIKLAVLATTCNNPGTAYSCHWATNYYYTAIQAGLFLESEILQTMFDCPIPRSDMALIVSNAVDQPVCKEDENVIHSYIVDISQAPNREEAVIKAYLLGIISGYSDRTFRPDAKLTRAEAATVILRLIDPSKRSTVDLDALKGTCEHQIFILTNQYREEIGLSSLSYNEQLANVAQIKAEDLRDQNYFDHASPTYGSPFDMLKLFNIQFIAAGENIAMGYDTPAKAMDAFMNSSAHKEILLHPAFTETGVGIAKDKDGCTYWVQLFIHP